MKRGHINVEKERVESLRKKAFKLLLILASGRRLNIKKIEPLVNNDLLSNGDSISRTNSGISFNTNNDLDSYFSEWNSGCNDSCRSTMTTPDLDLDSELKHLFGY